MIEHPQSILLGGFSLATAAAVAAVRVALEHPIADEPPVSAVSPTEPVPTVSTYHSPAATEQECA